MVTVQVKLQEGIVPKNASLTCQSVVHVHFTTGPFP